MKSFKEWLIELETLNQGISFPLHLKQSLDITQNTRIGSKATKIDINNSSNVILHNLYKHISKII